MNDTNTKSERPTTEHFAWFRSTVPEVVENLDWNEIMIVMHALGRRYTTATGLVPVTLEMAKECATKLLLDTINDLEKYPDAISMLQRTGGFDVSLEPHEEGMRLSIRFVVNESSTEVISFNPA